MKRVLIAILVLSATAAAQRTVTNADLDKFRKEREASERRLREDYARQGLGTPEQVARERAERTARLEAEYAASRNERIAADNEIIAEANELRRRIAALDAQIAYYNNAGASAQSPYRGGQVTTLGYLPFGGVYGGFYGGFGGRRGGYGGAPRPSAELQRISQLPPNMRTVQEYATMYPSSQGIFQQSVQGVRVAPPARRNGRGNYGNYGGYGGYIVEQSYAGGDLNSLLAARAGLMAEWRLVEEKARRAGVRLD